jgi:hypothetical protein
MQSLNSANEIINCVNNIARILVTNQHRRTRIIKCCRTSQNPLRTNPCAKHFFEFIVRMCLSKPLLCASLTSQYLLRYYFDPVTACSDVICSFAVRNTVSIITPVGTCILRRSPSLTRSSYYPNPSQYLHSLLCPRFFNCRLKHIYQSAISLR